MNTTTRFLTVERKWLPLEAKYYERERNLKNDKDTQGERKKEEIKLHILC